ncbi:MAG TPA: hypothetical protein VM030_11615 [Acidimicrobiales bacterium]|nr:hypothetical protein [Acidimicrobiales bacterium]
MSDVTPPLPDYVTWPTFPLEGDMRMKVPPPFRDTDRVRSGEPGGSPCESCDPTDEGYAWANVRWRVRATRPTALPMQLFLQTREHIDMDGLDEDMAGELGRLVVRLDRAIQSIGGVGRVHVSRWGDGGSHFHLWFMARPLGARHMLGTFLPLWADALPPTPDDVWQANLAVVAAELAKVDGHDLTP